MAKPGKAASEEAEAPAKPKSKRLVLAIVALLLLGAIGGGVWFFLKGRKHEEPKPVVQERVVFMDLEPFTVNLQRDEAGGDQFLQAGITLKLPNEKLQEKIKERLPEIRSRLLFLLSSKRPSELVPIAGKKKLAQDIAAEVNASLGARESAGKKPAAENIVASEVSPAVQSEVAPAPATAKEGTSEGVQDVLFTSFIIQ